MRNILIKISKFNFLHFIPIFKLIHNAYVLDDVSKKRIIGAKLESLKRSTLFWKWAPRKYWGGSVLNLFGLSFFRYLFFHLRYNFRFLSKKRRIILHNEGIEIVNSFLTDTEVNKILDVYQKNLNKSNNYFRDFSELIISNTKGIVNNVEESSEIHSILKNKNIESIAKQITGLDLKISPFISILHYKSFPEDKLQEDGQNIPHFDVFYPSFKMFIYLNNVNELNGAFKYLPKSHSFNLFNFLNYYKDCFLHYFLNDKNSIYPTDATVNLYKNNYKWVSANGVAGDLVLFNVCGIHARGEFQKDKFRERLVLLVDFRQVEVPIQNLAANV
jgi:hypothetical protein